MAGVLGIEPRLTDLESVVLPLNYTPILKSPSPVLLGSLRGLRMKSRCFGGTQTASYWERDFVAVLFSTGKTENPDPFQELGFSKGAWDQPLTHEDYGHP